MVVVIRRGASAAVGLLKWLFTSRWCVLCSVVWCCGYGPEDNLARLSHCRTHWVIQWRTWCRLFCAGSALSAMQQPGVGPLFLFSTSGVACSVHAWHCKHVVCASTVCICMVLHHQLLWICKEQQCHLPVMFSRLHDGTLGIQPFWAVPSSTVCSC